MRFKYFKSLIVEFLLQQQISSLFLSKYLEKRKNYVPLSQNHFGPTYPGTRNLDDSFISNQANSSQAYENWKIAIGSEISKGQNFVSLKFGDGDHYFFMKHAKNISTLIEETFLKKLEH